MPYCNLQTIIRWNIHLISRLQLFWHLIHLSFNQSVRSHFSQSIVTSYSVQHELCSTCNALHFGEALKIAPSIRCNASIFAFKYRHIISTYQTSTIIKCTDSWQILIVTPNHSCNKLIFYDLHWYEASPNYRRQLGTRSILLFFPLAISLSLSLSLFWGGRKTIPPRSTRIGSDTHPLKMNTHWKIGIIAIYNARNN